MTPLFKKLNLGTQNVIHVLNAPESFESELEALEGVTVKRTITGRSEFALAFVVTQAELNSASTKLAKACVGDALLWMMYPKRTSKKYKCDFNRDSGWPALGEAHGSVFNVFERLSAWPVDGVRIAIGSTAPSGQSRASGL